MTDVQVGPVEGTKQPKETAEQEEAKRTGISPDAPVLAKAPGTNPTPEQLANPDIVEVSNDPNDPSLAGNPEGQADRDSDKKKSKTKVRKFKVPSSASTEHFTAEVKQNASGVEVVQFRKFGSVGDTYEIAASQLDELVDLLGAL